MFESSFVLGPTQRIVSPFSACIQRYHLCPGALVQTIEFALWSSQADKGDRGGSQNLQELWQPGAGRRQNWIIIPELRGGDARAAPSGHRPGAA